MKLILDSTVLDEPVIMDSKDAVILYKVYEDTVNRNNIRQDVFDTYEMLKNSESFDEVLKVVKKLGKDHCKFKSIEKYIF